MEVGDTAKSLERKMMTDYKSRISVNIKGQVGVEERGSSWEDLEGAVLEKDRRQGNWRKTEVKEKCILQFPVLQN